jgi:hypothetical protein
MGDRNQKIYNLKLLIGGAATGAPHGYETKGLPMITSQYKLLPTVSCFNADTTLIKVDDFLSHSECNKICLE